MSYARYQASFCWSIMQKEVLNMTGALNKPPGLNGPLYKMAIWSLSLAFDPGILLRGSKGQTRQQKSSSSSAQMIAR